MMVDVGKDKQVNDVLEQLDAGVQHMDGETASKLRQVRAVAIEKGLAKNREKSRFGWILSGLALAPAIVLAIMLLLPPQPEVPVEAFVTEDMDIIVAPVEVDFFEDLEFYRWMNAQRVG